MKKLIPLTLVLALVLAIGLSGLANATAETAGTPVGVLSLMNMTEEEYLSWIKGKMVALLYLIEQGNYQSINDIASAPPINKVTFYDTLTDMVMGLQAGDIRIAELPECTADYLCAHNDALRVTGRFDLEGADDFTTRLIYRLGVGYSFMMLEDRAALRDALDQAIAAMREDGTLDALINAYIVEGISEDPEPVAFTQADGETIRIAVTGDLPPMDYVAADGTPAGFNTALLAELGGRLNKNFEIIQVTSLGRAAALASGQVDMVFWTSGYDGRLPGSYDPDANTEDLVKEWKRSNTEEQNEVMEALNAGLDSKKRRNMDIPEGTITTKPYYNDLIVTIAVKR